MVKSYSVNNQINAEMVNLVLSDGTVNESISLTKALEIAEEEGLDVVEVSDGGKGGLPVCKIVDYGKMIYQQNKKKKSNKQIKHTKEIKYSLNIDLHDLQVKHNKIFEFLSKHYTVRYTMELNGRERGMLDEAIKKINTNLEAFKGLATWRNPQVSKGRKVVISTTLLPI